MEVGVDEGDAGRLVSHIDKSELCDIDVTINRILPEAAQVTDVILTSQHGKGVVGRCVGGIL